MAEIHGKDVRRKSTSLAYHAKHSQKDLIEYKKENLFFNYSEDENDFAFVRNDGRYSTFTKKSRTMAGDCATENAKNSVLGCENRQFESDINANRQADANTVNQEEDAEEKSQSENSKKEVLKRPSNLNYQKVYAADLSLPDSPISEQSYPLGSRRYTDSEIRPDEKFARRSCSFYVDLRRDHVEKERLLLAHDQIGLENSNLKIEDDRSIESLLEELEDRSEGEFSSDSLESESMGGKPPPRRCVSDCQIFTKTSKSHPHNSQLKSYNEDLSDTDFSGLNSLQGSGDLLEMQEKDSELYKLDQYGRHSSASFFLNSNIYRSTESMLTNDSDRSGSIENILETGSHERIEKLFRNHEEGAQTPVTPKKSDAFFIEFEGSPRRHKPVLRAKSLPVNRNPEKLSIAGGASKVKTKPPVVPSPVVQQAKSAKVNRLTKKLSLKCNQQVLPNKIGQGINLTARMLLFMYYTLYLFCGIYFINVYNYVVVIIYLIYIIFFVKSFLKLSGRYIIVHRGFPVTYPPNILPLFGFFFVFGKFGS